MMKVICTSGPQLPQSLDAYEHAFSFFSNTGRTNVGNIANLLRGKLQKQDFAPSSQTWDFVQFCLAVCAADQACLRRTSADGWTRVIELTVGLHQPIYWLPWKTHIEALLKVLTGDYWTLNFISGGTPPPNGGTTEVPYDCVSLLSGGLDSLIGAIDLVSDGRRPLFVSQLANEDSKKQRDFAVMLGGEGSHVQLSHGIYFKGEGEPSTRGRSLAFYAFAVLAASKINVTPVQVFVPENGFISINPPLVPGRSSSLSTRTTHPLFMQMLQQLIDGLGINVHLELPYRFKTKGEMLRACQNQTLLATLAASTTSCGRYRTNNRQHCGRCVPCMIRKSAFLAWNPGMDTTSYSFSNLSQSAKKSGPDDPMAAALAVLDVRQKGINKFLAAALAFASVDDRPRYLRMLEAGMSEIETLLRRDGII